jgi:hypothetical protein
MYTFVAIRLVVQGQGGEDAQLDPGGVSVFLYRSDDLHCTFGFFLLVPCLHHFAKGTLAKQLVDGVCSMVSKVSSTHVSRG